MNKIKKMWKYYRQYGLKLLVMKIFDHYSTNNIEYMQWRREHEISGDLLKKQKEKIFRSNIIISIAVPVFHTPEIFLREMIESVQKQSYGGWELCIVDGSRDNNAYHIIQEYAECDSRIKVIKLKDNKGIAENTNAAIAMCTGDYIGLLDHDDLLEVNALYEVRNTIDKNPSVEFIYTDEDKISMDGKEFFDPHFKSDFNKELLRVNNYICHFVVVKKEIIKIVGGLHNKYDGAQDYDFILRCTEHAKHIEHIKKVLYHWRAHRNSTAEKPESKMYAYQSGKKAIEDHLERQGENAIVDYTDYLGYYHVKYEMVSQDWITVVIIKQGSSSKQIKKCIASIQQTIGYSRYDICIVDEIVELDEKCVKGTYILLVHGTISMISNNWMEELMGTCQRKNVGAVGIKLYNRNETIKHAGIILGMDGYAFEGWPRVRPGYFHRDALMQNLNAVTQKFMLISKKLFFGIKKEMVEKVDDERAFCKKIRDENKEVIYNPNVEAYINVASDIKKVEEHFSDSYYNENLELHSPGYKLKK